MITINGPPPENRLNATPVLRVWISLTPSTRSISSTREMFARTIALLIWSATTTATATRAVSSTVRRALIRGGSGSR